MGLLGGVKIMNYKLAYCSKCGGYRAISAKIGENFYCENCVKGSWIRECSCCRRLCGEIMVFDSTYCKRCGELVSRDG